MHISKNSDATRYIVSTVTAISILLAFLCGYLIALRQYNLNSESQNNTPIYIDLKPSSKGITIQHVPKNVFFRIDGNLIQSGSIDLK